MSKNEQNKLSKPQYFEKWLNVAKKFIFVKNN